MTQHDQTESTHDAGEFYKRLCEHAAVALVATDAEFNIICWNSAAAELLGRSIADMIGKPLAQAVPPERQKLLKRLLRRTVQRGLNSQFDVRLAAPDGKTKNLMIILSPIPAREGKVQGVAAWIVDETHRKQLAEQLARAEKNASLGTFAAGVAHHFNNIFGGVATFVDFALTSGDVVTMKRALQMTAEAAAKASKITQSLLSFAERDAHRTDLADLTEVVLTFIHLVERPLAERHIKLELNLRPVPIIAVEANRMHQVLGNLLANAEEAMSEGGTIRITIDRSDGEVVLSFADTGCGIKPEHLPIVFEPFFTTKGLLAGGEKANPGLGLSVAKGIIVEMGGKIEARSTPGQGTTFIISFPISARKTR
ncbi:MAG: PAS domain S-box protein [Phycisphaerae bacterium]|nr:PAS domain S-box protein [Phycisphaerae bacterium]